MNRIFSFVLGRSRITSVIGYVIGLPGVYDAITAFAAGQPVNGRNLLLSVGAAIFGRLTQQERKQ